MDELRKPFYFAALIAFFIAWALEGASVLGLTPSLPAGPALFAQMKEIAKEGPPKLDDEQEIAARASKLVELSQENDPPPGMGIALLALLDVLVFATIFFMGAGMFFRTQQWGRIQSVLNLILSLIVLFAAIALAFISLAALLMMVGLFLAVPFGTLAYLAIFGFFPRGAAAAVLSSAMIAKLVSGACLFLAQQRILFAKLLVAIFATSLLGGVIVAFLHGFPPLPLVSITDALAAIVVAVIAAIWALILLVLSILAVIRGITSAAH